ncbi:MAG: Coenzyme F420 hydrogenase/dehydrogenase, beta subunit C-terminal domain [Clostridia bacterium]|nr:Coenzyme F420 hydrogenase/dehydrogenase, beta subunit C-terminal domain [Clostridia bacterium]
MNTYFETNHKTDCNGCGACALRCPVNAISMIEDGEGFVYPQIDNFKCVNCGLCRRVCSNYPLKNTFESKVYAAKSKDFNLRMNSTSGGMFQILAEYVIAHNGVVFGATYSENLVVKHSYATTKGDCKKFSVSKYVRSDLGTSYEDVECFLKDGKNVLFSGVPCQCYGLRKNLGKDYDNLIICEILCHSNPSPKVFEMYLKNLEKLNGQKIKNYVFRSKDDSVGRKPHIVFENGVKKADDLFNKAFFSMLISRPSCHNCKFCDPNRKADITIGDFWGIEHYYPEFKDENGISLVCINSEIGVKVFNDIQQKLDYIESNLSDAFKYNHNSNIPENKNRETFFEGIESGKINSDNVIEYMQKYSKKPFVKRAIGKVKRIINTILRKK